MDSLSARVIVGGVVYPTIRVASHPGKLLMGVYDGTDSYVEGTVLDRRSGEQGAPVPPGLFPSVSDSPDPEAIYLGPLYFHYGHFLLESLARAWYAHRHPQLPLVWAGAHTWQDSELKPWQVEILDILQITNPTRISADPTRFASLHVPDIGYRYDDRFHPDHARFLARYDGQPQIPGHQLWLSRSKIGNDVRDVNSAATERRLSTAGWTIVHPELLSIREQLDHLSRAEIVAGEEGSAFHSLVLLRDVTTKKFTILRRLGPEHGSLQTIGDARDVDQTFYTLERERVLRAEGRVVSKLTPNASEILDLLDVPVPPPGLLTPSTECVLLDRISARLEPQTLLEVGAASPTLTVGSTAPTRVAVCPRFAVDPRTFADSGVEFYELDLAHYADHLHDGSERFDVIRIAGSTLETIMDSFRLSKRLAHADTTWILGSGDLAARTALAIRVEDPGFVAKRVFVRGLFVYVVQEAAGEPLTAERVAEMPMAEVKKRVRWLPLLHLGRRPRVPEERPRADESPA